MDHAEQAKKLRDRAQECRQLAQIVQGEEARASYLALADAYETLAQREDAMTPIEQRLIE
jgi:hypothetical protein